MRQSNDRHDATGLHIHYYTGRGSYAPPHFHSDLELHYIIDGTGEIVVDGSRHVLYGGELFVVDSNSVHEILLETSLSGITIHVPRHFLLKYVPDLDSFHLECKKDLLSPEKFEEYMTMCGLLGGLQRLYRTRPRGYEMGCESIAMEVLFILVNHFTVPIVRAEAIGDGAALAKERLGEITAYVNVHYRENISLEQIAGSFGVSREYFCRFFKKHMGISFVQHLQRVRLVHIHEDVLYTQDSIMDIALRHGFTNYKLFTKTFREIYGHTPSQLRRLEGTDLPKA